MQDSPLYTVKFLRAIIQRGLLHFSIKGEQWTWDAGAVKEQIMPNVVVDLLARKLCRLPRSVV